MNYGHFDELNKEYVITRPDTPSAWANYLGDPEYGAIISNNAGGYSFVKSGANGRVISATSRPTTTGPLHGRPYASPSISSRASAATVPLTPLSLPSTRALSPRLLTMFPRALHTRYGLPG